MTIRLVAFDFDGTLVHGFPPDAPYIWRLLHDWHGSPREALDRQRRLFLAGGCTYEEWFRHDLRCLKAVGATRESLQAALAPLHRVRGAHRVFSALRARGCRLAILSGSVDLACDHFFPSRPFDTILVNHLHFNPDGRLAGGEPTDFDMGRKADGLRHLGATWGLGMDEIAFVGDASNDVDAARVAGLSIAFNCRDAALRAVAHHTVPWPAEDLRAILDFVG